MYTSKPSVFLASRPLRYCSLICDCGLNRPANASTMYEVVHWSSTAERMPSRGAASLSRYAPACSSGAREATGVPGVPTALLVHWNAVVVPSRSTLLAMAATAGLMTRPLKSSSDRSRSASVNCTSTWNCVVRVTGTLDS